MSRRFSYLACLALTTACFNPEDPALDTDGGTSGSMGPDATASSTDLPTSGAPTSSSTGTTTIEPTGADSSSSDASSSGGAEVPSWGEGEPPDFGDLGDEGEGNVLAVHALPIADALDVWLVGDAQPVATDLAPGDATRIEGVSRDARRVVFARAGTLEAVGCSAWFPLRADEQWAAVASRGEHDCVTQDGGDTPTFEQALSLSGNTVRFVHAGRPDPLTIERGGVSEGMLPPGETLVGSDLPDCESSGCSIGYTVSSGGIGAPRFYTFATVEVSDVPPPGEFMMVVTGDVRQEWPGEPDSISAIAVTIEGDSRRLRRDPEVAFTAPATTSPIDFLIPTPPSVSPVASAPQCFPGEECVLEVQRFRPGSQQFYAQDQSGGVSADGQYELDAGERYVLVLDTDEELTLLRDVFGREDETTAIGRAANWTGAAFTIGRVFGGEGQAFESFENVPADTVSEENELPAGDWDLVHATGGGGLGAGCFSPTQTPEAWRGFLWVQDFEPGIIDLSAWPPRMSRLMTLCF
ncbi:MAG: hypothetical protein ACE37F_33620 [Nannocystaceae bacterium]|nr:DUF4397 domain-containing protein [bacterium]